ncbi:glycoside hydrolase family protein [Anaeromyxobacter diazotrophicus]|uniref:Asl1-like glycosyl hydrolase catalytic domain-containing protein n=1 Tax=Anaeromyxobacter diazotrophicus TaxID=2590199 RepID=A0A7I9VMW1_9BACT|nr:glycoside hydrolase family protein [Anaeromyxobacter diazotrophicus]GEJ57721.1 hypothetical protein AMYX_24620 [Anaeromyxobacter diazotrophicus]
MAHRIAHPALRAVALLAAAASLACGGAGDGAQLPRPAPGTKRGVAYGFQSPAELRALTPQVTWWYDWSTHPDAPMAGDADAEFVPMVWGGQFDVDQVIRDIPQGAKYLLAFNEPNFKSQANLTAAQAAALWPAIEQIADARGLAIVSPAVNYCGPSSACNGTDPFQYLRDFFAACPGCRVDHVAVHWYACDSSALAWYLDQAAAFGKPIWLTEFACGDGDAQQTSLAGQEAYMTAAVAALEADPRVFRYAWFADGRAVPNVALTADGALTALGRTYAAAGAAR